MVTGSSAIRRLRWRGDTLAASHRPGAIPKAATGGIKIGRTHALYSDLARPSNLRGIEQTTKHL